MIDKNGNDKYQTAMRMLQNDSLELAITKLKALAKNGDGHAEAVLGILFEFGKGHVGIDTTKALSHYERSVTSVDSLQGWMGVGRISLIGPSSLRNYIRAYECFTVAAERSDYPQAWLALGEINLRGLGVQRNLKIAADCFRHAAELGNVFGYTGLAKVASEEKKTFKSIRYRIIAAFKALAAPDESDSVKPW